MRVMFLEPNADPLVTPLRILTLALLACVLLIELLMGIVINSSYRPFLRW